MASSKTRRIRYQLWRDGKRDCVRCGKPIATREEATIEHIVAKALGGTDDRSNLGLSHLICNRHHGIEVSFMLEREAALKLP